MLNEEKLKSFTLKSYAKDIVKVNDHIYFFIGYGHSNAIAIIAHHSVILVDTLDSDVRSKILLEDLKKITDKPVKTIIFTHGHPDHRGGAATFKDTVEEIIAFDSMKMPPKYFDRITPFLNERGEKQFGIALSDEEAISQGIGIREGRAVNEGTYQFLKPTTLYHEDKIERDIDGIHLELVRAPGECDDELFIYLPDDKVMCAGDNYVGCFPNLYAIRGTPYRDVTVWIETQAKIKEVIGNYKDAIESILFQTLDCMRQGMTLDETVQAVHLEDKYQSLEYLEEYYGTVEWSVKSIYNGYVGWFDGNVNQLMPVSLNVYNKTLLELIGEDKLIEKVKNLMQKEEYQLALQLLELVDDYKDLKKECLLNRAKQMTSANARHYFICAAKEL